MIVDPSAIVAIHDREPDAEALRNVLADSRATRLSAASYVECAVVLDRRSLSGRSRLDEVLDDLNITLADFTEEQARVARRAHQRFGRGSGSQARLNLGDCFSYALAITEDEPLLFKGDDFTHTDVRNALMESDHH